MYRKHLHSVFLLLLAFPSFAQQWQEGEVVPMAPEAWSFIKYGNQSSPDLYTGTLHVNIPLYTYKDPDFEFPVQLSYTTSGYQPNRTTGVTGLGWNLSAGGVVTREIHGIPDDASGMMEGALFRNQTDYHANPFDCESAIDANWTFYYKANSSHVEAEPDIFSFRFPGHSGKFILRKNQNTVSALFYGTSAPAGEYRFEVSGSAFPLTAFSILTGDGYRYSFAKQGTSLTSYTVTYDWSGSDLSSASADAATSWYLTDMTAPNGRSVHFEYETPGFNECVMPFSGFLTHRSDYLNDQPLAESIVLTRDDSWRGFRKCGSSYSVLTKVVVEDAGWEMQSYTSDRLRTERFKRSQQDAPATLTATRKLDSLVIRRTTDGFTLKRIRFSYKGDSDVGNPVLLLKEVRISGEGTYRMDYYTEDHFPFQGVTSIDHWGYLNTVSSHRYELDELVPPVFVDPVTMDQVIDTTLSLREPNPEAAKAGCLVRLTYPTGGYTTYSYEGNTCSVALDRTSTSGYRPTLRSVGKNVLCGGLRILQISDYPLSSPAHTRTFDYSEGGKSSGLLLKVPKYYAFLKMTYGGAGTTEEYLMYHTSSSNFSYPLDEYDLCYTSVSEIESNGARTQSIFTTPHEEGCRDEFPEHFAWINESQINLASTDQVNAFVDMGSHHLFREKVSARRHFSAGEDRPWKTEITQYGNFQTTVYPYVSGVKRVYNLLYESRIFLDNCLPSEKTDIFYEGTDSLSIREAYSYNGLNQLTEICTRDEGMGTASLIRNQHLADTDISGKPVYLAMKNQNIVRQPIRTLKAFCSVSATPTDEQYRLTEAHLFDFGFNGSQICVSAIKRARIRATVFSGFPSDDDMVTESSFLYNALNRPIQVSNRAGRPTTFIWGHHGLYPVAKIENATAASISGLLGASLSGSPLAAGLSETQEALLYDGDAFETTLFSWAPFIGVTRICDPSGKSMYYSYDLWGRLNQVADDLGHPVQEFKYNVLGGEVQ